MTGVYYNDNDPQAAEWLRTLMAFGQIPFGFVDERSILDVEPADLASYHQCHFFAGIGGWAYALQLADWPTDRPVWTGSPPCQPFSAAGRRISRDDPRHLAPKFASLVGACRPTVLFGEQVASADVFGKAAKSSGKGATEAPEWAWLDDLSDRLEAAYYAIGASDFSSAGVGAPHIRQRTFFGAVDLRSAAGWLADSERDRQYRYRNRGSSGWNESANTIDFGGLGDSDRDISGRRPAETFGPQVESGCVEEPDGDGPVDANQSILCGLGDSDSWQRNGLTNGEGRGTDWSQTGRNESDGRPQRVVTVGGSADTNGRDTGTEWKQPCREHGCQSSDGGDGQWLADADDTGPQGRRGMPERTGKRAVGSSGLAGATNPTNGFWGDADWLRCRDDKWRPVEPGTFPLADGVPGRVGLLRGYGNAINPWAAKAFIEAFGEVALT